MASELKMLKTGLNIIQSIKSCKLLTGLLGLCKSIVRRLGYCVSVKVQCTDWATGSLQKYSVQTGYCVSVKVQCTDWATGSLQKYSLQIGLQGLCKSTVYRLASTVYDRLENTAGKRKNFWSPTFFPYLRISSKALFRKLGVCGTESTCFPNNKILALTRLKAFAVKKFNLTKITVSYFSMVKNS